MWHMSSIEVLISIALVAVAVAAAVGGVHSADVRERARLRRLMPLLAKVPSP
jgi:hypothetical protein